MIFGYLELEPIVQENDKTRLDASKSFASKDEAAISLVEIEPDTGAGFIDVTGNSSADWYLDWQYPTDGTKNISLRITTDGAPSITLKQVEVISAADDKLWSIDQDLVSKEPDVLKYVRQGRNSFLDIHRSVQTKILDWVASIRITATDGTRLTKDDFLVTEELRQLSCYWVLELIYSGISNKPDDVFAAKATTYGGEAKLLKNMNIIQPDLNRDGDITETDKVDMRSFSMVRR